MMQKCGGEQKSASVGRGRGSWAEAEAVRDKHHLLEAVRLWKRMLDTRSQRALGGISMVSMQEVDSRKPGRLPGG